MKIDQLPWRVLTTMLLLGLLAGCGGGATSSTIVTPVSTTSTQASATSAPSLSDQIGALVAKTRSDDKIPGATVGVWTPKGETMVIQGVTDPVAGTPFVRGDRSAIRSITKSFTVTLILQLVDEGMVGLDAPVSRYVSGVPSGDVITLRMLAGMRSGLPDYSSSKALIDALIADPTRTWTTPELLAFAFALPMSFPPGTQYQYCNTNTLVLGEVVEAVTGKRFEEVLQDRLLTPLAMRDTLYLTGPTIPPPSTPGYAYDPATASYEALVVSFSGLGAAGAMASTVDDMHVWAAALGSGRLLSALSQAARLQMSSPITNGPEYDAYGLGLGQIDGWLGHTGEGLGYEACAFYDPLTRSCVAILLNATGTKDVPAKLLRQISPLVRASLN